MYLEGLRKFVSQYAISEWPDLNSPRCTSTMVSVDIFYNRILKTMRQCEFPDMDDHIIDAIIFGTNCVKDKDKLLHTPKPCHYNNIYLWSSTMNC